MDSMQPLSTPTMSFLVCGATASEKKKNNKKLVKSNKKDTVPKNKTHKHKKGALHRNRINYILLQYFP